MNFKDIFKRKDYVRCECGKRVHPDRAVMTEDGQWTCLWCYQEMTGDAEGTDFIPVHPDIPVSIMAMLGGWFFALILLAVAMLIYSIYLLSK